MAEMPLQAADSSPNAAAPEAFGSTAGLPERVVFYDGECGFCDFTVRWLLDHDRRGRFHFAPLQGPTAARLRAAHPGAFPERLETLVLLDTTGPAPRFLLRSEAAFVIAEQLEGAVRYATLLRVLPRFLTDLGYRLIAASRYLFGRLDTCRLPTPEERHRFLDTGGPAS